MDILDNVATELGFEFHLYIVRDELFGAKYRNFKDWIHNTNGKDMKNYGHKSNTQHQSGSSRGNSGSQYQPTFGIDGKCWYESMRRRMLNDTCEKIILCFVCTYTVQYVPLDTNTHWMGYP